MHGLFATHIESSHRAVSKATARATYISAFSTQQLFSHHMVHIKEIWRVCLSLFYHSHTQLTICSCISQVQCYDPETDSWLLRANIPIAKRCITAVSLNNLIYVCGGLTKSIFCYDPAEDYWIHVVHTFNKQVIN